MRFTLQTTASRVNLNGADTWQKAGDVASQWLTANTEPGESVIVRDTLPGNAFPFVRFDRADIGGAYVGTPFRTMCEALSNVERGF